MRKSALNYGVIAQGYVLRDGELHTRLGSAGVRHFDQRLGLFRTADEARAWARAEGHDAYQLQRCHSGYRTARPIGCMLVLNPDALHAPVVKEA